MTKPKPPRIFVKCTAPIALGMLMLVSHMLLADTAKVPRFSVTNLDHTVKPENDFYRYACGAWLKANPVPSDKARWSGFDELQQRNWQLLHEILETSVADTVAPPKTTVGEIGSFYASAMDSNRIEELRFKPLVDDFARIGAANSTTDIVALVSYFGQRGIAAMFTSSVAPDARNSRVYAYQLSQGGLGLPDRDYYLSTNFAKQRQAYDLHIAKMFTLLGINPVDARYAGNRVLDIETALAKASKSRTDLRDPIANYHKLTVAEAESNYPSLNLGKFLDSEGLPSLPEIIIRQPEFFAALDQLLKQTPLNDWKLYLRWHLLRASAPYLYAAAENESFNFYGAILSGQPVQEPRWQRAAKVIDANIGEALGQLYIQKNFPPAARARIAELIENLKSVFRARLEHLEWMSEETRRKALVKFDRFTQKIACPEKFRDYTAIELRRNDYIGNVRRSAMFEAKRQIARVGQPVDHAEWRMTPQTVNAYFSPLENEIVFPAGILQPPFFDVTMDDAVNYGAIGVVIGHEMTHGYDDQGRKYDGDGNLNDWWTPADGKAFEERAQKLIDQYGAYEALPGLHVNGRLTLGENIADLGGMAIAFEALQRELAKDPSKAKKIDGFTPEQRFFLSFAQVWRTNWREAELRRRITVDPHSPGQFRAVGPEKNLQQFFDAFAIKEGAPMWRAVAERAVIW